MPYKIKRLNATPADLSPEKHDQCIKVFEVFKMTKPVIRPMERAALVEWVDEFGGDKVIHFIERWALLGYNSMDSLYDLIIGKIPSERTVATKAHVNEMPGSDRSRRADDFKPIADVLKQVAPVKYPTDDFVYDGAAAGVWMRANGRNVKDYAEYFDILPQRSADGKNLLQLKSEYR